MSAPVTIVVVTAEDLHAAADEIETSGWVEWADQGGNTVRLELPRDPAAV
ncbi:hypothetical protein [Streptomyces sp. NBC_00582]|nr:hypothetical protein [Streptomyces sp. NBC_00582]WUB68344.1 hypothetical protein OG852_49430 [Streptomyces sp. NBC_00582]